MDPTCTPKPQLRIKNTNIYLDETVTHILIVHTTYYSALLCYDDVRLYDKFYKMYRDNHNFIKVLKPLKINELALQIFICIPV